MPFTKNHMIDSIHETLYFAFSKKEISDIVNILIELIKKSLEDGEDVLITGFGKFCVKAKKERQDRNPAIGEPLMFSPRKVVTFKCSTKLKNMSNKRAS